ncbi:macrophage mannose receptor 1-like [Pecten maximus]|uniref:macrophage mannose receptor 1-like n=1 Tax=Pecten maximus TaxID=6579 RepID=UPI001457EABE|nr:macrophage mannose receptor 1-like [Pecten maximus]
MPRISILMLLAFILHVKGYHDCDSSTWIYTDPVQGDICYWYVSSTNTAASSNDRCEDKGGMLAYIPNAAAFSFVLGLLNDRDPYGSAYVGYTMNISGYLEIQNSGYLQSWADWGSGQPAIDIGECVVVDAYTKQWKVTHCSDGREAVCSPPYTYVAATSMASPTTSPTAEMTTSMTPYTTTSTTTGTITSNTLPGVGTMSNPPDCQCHCNDSYTIVIYPVTNITDELQTKLDSLKQETMVNEEALSSTIRKRTSASDPRPSSAYVGYLGVALLSLIFGGILLLDLPRLILMFKK